MHTVDVILPFHRDDRFLRIAINSIRNNKDVVVRLILVDDREFRVPTRDLDSIISISTGGRGYAAAINSALPFLKSDYVALMNSDDWSSPDRFIKQISALERSGKSFSVCALKKFRGFRVIPALLGELQGDIYDPRVLLLGAYGANATWLAKRETWIQHVRFEESQISDWLSSFNIFEKIPPVFVHENLYWYRQHNQQITNTESQQKESTRDLIATASILAGKLEVFDADFEMNFRITAAPYSLDRLPERRELLAAWRYLNSLQKLRLAGAENILLRRRFFLSLKLLQRGYIRFNTLSALLVGFMEVATASVGDWLVRVPDGLRNAKSELEQS